MRVTRRTFLKVVGASAAALGLSQTQVLQLADKVMAEPWTKPAVVWLHGANCTGCTTSFAGLEWDADAAAVEGLPAATAEIYEYLQTLYPGSPPPVLGASGVEFDSKTTVDDVLLDILDVQYLPTIMATAGKGAYDAIKGWMTSFDGVLVVEGAIPTDHPKYCGIADNQFGTDEVALIDAVKDIATNSAVVIACGTCASFGGIPAAQSDSTKPRTNAMSVKSFLQSQGVGTTVVNVPGCPIHPDWMLGTVAHYILTDLLANLDDWGRPKFYYGDTIHGGKCPRYQAYCSGQFAAKPGDSGCLAMIGCKGFSTYSDCAFGGPHPTKVGRGWNDQTSSCINNGHPCMGCTEKGYPDRFGPFLKY